MAEFDELNETQKIQVIMEALMVDSVPNTPASYVEDDIQYNRELLITRLNEALAGHPDAHDMVQRYRDDPAMWEGVLFDALLQTDVAGDADVVAAARKTVRDARPVEEEDQYPRR